MMPSRQYRALFNPWKLRRPTHTCELGCPLVPFSAHCADRIGTRLPDASCEAPTGEVRRAGESLRRFAISRPEGNGEEELDINRRHDKGPSCEYM